MKFTVDLPEIVINPIRRTCEGFGVSTERGLAIIISDWVASLDAQFTLEGKPTTPAYLAFDGQFNEQTPDGFEIESSYDMSRANWMQSLAGNLDALDGEDWHQK
jgi:hypothetical protein